MKSIIALGVGLVVALAPGGTAFAEEAPSTTGKGKAYGNCQHSSAGGDTERLVKPLDLISHGKGNGGWVQVAKYDKGCVLPTDEEELQEPVVNVVVDLSGDDYVAPDDEAIT